MAREVIDVDRDLLASWPVPEPQGSKHSRGDVLVIGGARSTPGAAQLAGLSALRVGAGRLTLGVAASVAATVAVAVPESGVLPLEETADFHVRGRSVRAFAADVAQADAVLVGPGLDEIREARRMLAALTDLVDPHSAVVLDAYALGALAARRGARRFRHPILTPNESEAEVLLGRSPRELADDTVELAERYEAVVSCMGIVADALGEAYRVREAGPGLGTSGSGDVQAGAITGFAARGCSPLQAAVWGTYLHARAGQSLAQAGMPVGYLARDLSERLPGELGALA
ncbi:NAD(P)H-hydrate dehydratase [Gryllotalpicola daejeonensis]|uniref:ADP-dependent (S)-NAD(P)H-hydrate dehydratase n=1 Tax=Gryllotalpicola daejeonensis TaxID=993087 RepID=A0ABP7ZK32_9MICO